MYLYRICECEEGGFSNSKWLSYHLYNNRPTKYSKELTVNGRDGYMLVMFLIGKYLIYTWFCFDSFCLDGNFLSFIIIWYGLYTLILQDHITSTASGVTQVYRPIQNTTKVWAMHYIDVIMTTMASQITSLTVVYSTVYSDADQRKHQSSASLAFVWGIHRDWWIPRTKGQLRGKCFHFMTSSWCAYFLVCFVNYMKITVKKKRYRYIVIRIMSYQVKVMVSISAFTEIFNDTWITIYTCTHTLKKTWAPQLVHIFFTC